MADGDHTRAVTVVGRNRLVVDVLGGVVAGLPDGPPVIVLVDPEPEHWEDVDRYSVVIVLSEPEGADVLHLMRRGADAVIPAAHALTDLADAVETVRNGGVVLRPDHARMVVDAMRAQPSAPPITLTRRERDIISSVKLGDSVKQTALRLGIAQKTVENLQRRLFRKLEVRNRAQAVARVHELGLLGSDTTIAGPPEG